MPRVNARLRYEMPAVGAETDCSSIEYSGTPVVRHFQKTSVSIEGDKRLDENYCGLSWIERQETPIGSSLLDFGFR